jgi:hypothetical protein
MENSVGEKFAQKNLGATQNKSCEVKIHLGPGNFDFFFNFVLQKMPHRR